MKTSDFYYDLPPELIAQKPLENREDSKLLLLDKNTGKYDDHHFYELPVFLNKGDTLILNDTKVIPARLYGKKEDTGGSMEFLLLKQHGLDVWEVLVKPGRRAKVGTVFIFGDGSLKAEILSVIEGGNRLVRFYYDGEFYDILERIGQVPLPPHITEKLSDKDRYQTVYANYPGSAAAPTAGLHFTNRLLETISNMGVNIGYVTLHVGVGTFRPVKTELIEDHPMHFESYHIPKETAQLITRTKNNSGRIIAVGTTSCRTLEAGFDFSDPFESSGNTNLFIYPGYKFRVIDALITNFHLPESTLLMLVSALAGRDNVLAAYKHAVEEKYRFVSFGDAMFIY